MITFEECWPLAVSLSIFRDPSSKHIALLNVAKAAKQKDAAGLGLLTHKYQEGDHSMLDCVPDRRMLKIFSEALKRPDAYFRRLASQSKGKQAADVIWAAKSYLPAASWQWDKACILAAALLAMTGEVPKIDAAAEPSGQFPYWIALDKHTPEGKLVLTRVAKVLSSSHRKLLWSSFYCESACVNRLLPSRWWEAAKTWRLRRAGLSPDGAEELWLRARGLVREQLKEGAASLKKFVATTSSPDPSLSKHTIG